MTQCPHGDHELQLRPPVEHNVEQYGGSSTAATVCCGKAVRVSRRTGFNYDKTIGTEDDWGHPIKS